MPRFEDDENEEIWEEDEEFEEESLEDDDDEPDEDEEGFGTGSYGDDDGDDEDGDGDDFKELMDLGEELAESGELRRALRLWRKGVDRFPEEQEAWYQLGLACFRVLQEETEHHDIWEDDAELAGLFEEATGALEESTTIDEDHFHTWNLLGALYALRRNHESAVECWEKSLAINPKQKQVQEDLKQLKAEMD